MNDQTQEKYPWPGLWALQQACMYENGLISDRSGFDAINLWETTASPEDIELMHKKAHALGWFTGYFGSGPIWNTIFRWLGL